MTRFHHPLSLTVIHVISRGAYFLVFLVIANTYGANATTDSIFLIYAPLAVAVTVVAGIAEVVVIPFAHRAQARGCFNAFRTLLKKKALLVVAAASPLLLILSFAISATVTWASFGLLPIPVLATYSAIQGGLLNAAQKFRAAAVAPVAGAGAAALCLLALPRTETGLVLTLLAYEVGRAVFMRLYAVTGSAKIADAAPEKAANLLRQSVPGVLHQGLGSLLVASNPVVDMLFARSLEAGAVSAVEYANRMWVIIPLLFSGPLVIFHSRVSASASRNGFSARAVNGEAYRLGGLALLAGAFVMWLTNVWLIDALYGWGEMETDSRADLAWLFVAYLAGAGPYVASLVYIRTFSAVTRTDLITKAAVLSIVLNASLDWVLVQFMGLTGLGLATSLTYFAVAVYMWMQLHGLSLRMRFSARL